ncbi:MAG TPA: FMN-binding protein, partial [Saprospiraceae bacterium]|nr:FMN-binding protein [Saprospiraceae bacterium]
EVSGQLAEKINLAQEKKKPEADRLLPVFVYKDAQGKPYYILSVRGNGLWDEIWGSIALDSDMNTIAGVSFDHKGETPGLGAEIKDSPAFP